MPFFVKSIYQEQCENYVFWRGSEKFSNLPKITQLLKGGVGNDPGILDSRIGAIN